VVQIGTLSSGNFGAKNVSSLEIVADCLASFRRHRSFSLSRLVRMLRDREVDMISNTGIGF
jgi:hypothetical protein